MLGAAIPAWPVVTGAEAAGHDLLGAAIPAWPVETGAAAAGQVLLGAAGACAAGKVFTGACAAGKVFTGPWAAGKVFVCADAVAAKPKLSTVAALVPIKRLNVIDAIST